MAIPPAPQGAATQLLVGHDRSEHGDNALRAARMLSSLEGGLTCALVVVLTQRDLDATGELSLPDKQAAAIERTYPSVWKRIEPILEEEGAEGHGLEVDVIVKVAPGHLARSEQRIAEVLLEVAADVGAARIVLGRHGRPASVAEHVLGSALVVAGRRESLPEGVAQSVIVVRRG